MITLFDLHIHSQYSIDSLLKPRKIIKVARKKGLSSIAITDHNTIKGGLITRKIAKKEDIGDFLVIVGSEIKTDIGDLTGLFLNSEIKSRSSMSVIDEIKAQDGIVVLPHPFRGHKWEKIDNELLRRIDAIEVLNGRSTNKQNVLAQNFARNKGIPMVGGSDAHFTWEIGNILTIMKDDASDEEDIRKNILEGKTKISGGETLPYLRVVSEGIRIIKKITVKFK